MKAIVDNQLLPEINVRGDTPMRLLRFRIVSDTKNVSSQWSTIQKIVPAKYNWVDVTSANIAKVPIAIQYDHSTKTISWHPNKFVGTVASVDSAIGITVTNALRKGDEVLLPEYALFSNKRDGVFLVTDATGSSVSINLNPVENGPQIGDTISFIVSPPTNNVDVYIRFKQDSTVVTGYNWRYLATANVNASYKLAAVQFPPASANTIEIALQQPTRPKIRYTINEQDPAKMCEILLCKTSIQYIKTTTLT